MECGKAVLLTIVKLAVGLLPVDDVEAIGDVGYHTTHLEVEPLVILRRVDIGVENQVILISVGWRLCE